MFKKIILSLLSLFLLTSCLTTEKSTSTSKRTVSAPYPEYKEAPFENPEICTVPEANEELFVHLGEPLFLSGIKTSRYELTVLEDIPYGNFVIKAGEYSQKGYNDEQALFEGYYEDSKLKRIFVININNNDFIYQWGRIPLNKYTESENHFIMKYNTHHYILDDMQQELIYNGVKDNIIKLEYREFKDNLIRSPFSLSVEYDLSDSNIIGYKGALLEILEANNIGLKYKILKGFI